MKYKVIIDLGWHEADTEALAIEEATSLKYKAEAINYVAIEETRMQVLENSCGGHGVCVCETCTEAQREMAWAQHKDQWGYYTH